MTKDELQQFATHTADLFSGMLREALEPIKRELELTKQAAVRAADLGHEVITRIDRLETTQRVHGIRLDDHQEDLTRLGDSVRESGQVILGLSASVHDLLGRVTALETPQTKKERVG
jgi:hypothetical protein